MLTNALCSRSRRRALQKAYPVLIVAIASWWPTAVAHAQAKGDAKVTRFERGVDTAIRPGDDFFGYANGAWLKLAEIPAGKDRWGARDEINDLVRQRITRVLDAASAAPRGSTARKVADFRAAYLNETEIEARGTAPLKPLLDSIVRVHDKSALVALLGASMRADVDPLNWGLYQSGSLLGLSVEPSIHGETAYVPFLLQGGLGLGDREYYLSAEPRMEAIRASYRAHLSRALSRAGFANADPRAEAVMALETAIARAQATREASANDHNADLRWTRADFARNAPGIDWSAFFAAAGLSAQDAFVVWQPGAVTGIASLVASQPIESWQDYLRVRAIDRYADVLPRAFADDANAVRAAATGQPPESRAQRARAATELAMGDAVGRMYVEQYFPQAQKARVQAIVANVAAAFVRRVESSTWMAPATKARALAKLKKLYVGIGYPEQWQDYSDLSVDPLDAIGNARRAEDRNYRRAMARLGHQIDMTEWWIAPQTVGAVLVFQQNAYDFSAALLQSPKFAATASDAANYGAIGAIIGHDVSHFVDRLGAEYDTDGALRHWWTADDSTRFARLSEPLVAQFSGYRPFPDLAVNGTLTESENIADLAGLSAAFDAYRRSLGVKAADKAYVRQQDREFFIAFARSWRARLSDVALRAQLRNDHAPEMYRVATVRNLDAWYDAFDVRPDQRLYLAPAARVRIW